MASERGQRGKPKGEPPSRDIKKAIRRLVGARGSVQSADVVDATRVSRQAVHRHLRELVAAGELVIVGKGRAARYEVPGRVVSRLRVRGMEEHVVWDEVASKALERLGGPLSPEASSSFHYAFTELLNNAIDHAGSTYVAMVFERAADGRLAFEVIDEGVGIWKRLREGLSLADDMQALQELSKGKATTMAERHTGEGIFFSSKVADLFEIESGVLCWMVDNLRSDIGVGTTALRTGTRVRFELDPRSHRDLQRIFEEYTEDFEFSKSRTHVKLFTIGTRFVSRSEARRVVHGLERFRDVILDFAGVGVVGQGFADEVFRVWGRAHPETRLTATNAVAPVAFMIERARRA